MRNAWTGGQYSFFRVLLGVYLCIHFAHLLPWSAELFSSEGVLPDGGLSPIFAAFPNWFAINDSPWFVHATLVLAAIGGLLLAIGKWDRAAALWLWVVLAGLYGRNPLIANPAAPYVGFMLLAHLFVQRAPFGSHDARQRDDPDGGWSLSPAVFLAAWVVLCVSYSYSGYTKLLSPSWVAGDNIGFVLLNPLARDWFLRDFMLWVPPVLLSLLTWTVLYVELLFAPIALWRRARPWIWLTMLFIQFGFLFLLKFPDLTIGMLLFHLMTFDPQWLKARAIPAGSVLYYDGGCALCHGTVRFLLAEERTAVLRFAPLQGAGFAARLSEAKRKKLPDSIVLDATDGTLRTRSAAVVWLLMHLGGIWAVLGWMLWLIPRPLRDLAYDGVGAIRYRVFGRANDVCPVMSPEMRRRFALS